MLDQLAVDWFVPLVGDAFVICAADGGIDATLVEATPLGTPPAGAGRVPFGLLWEGPLDPRLQQGLHEVRHASLDEPLVIFLVPVAQTETAMQYQAIFS